MRIKEPEYSLAEYCEDKNQCDESKLGLISDMLIRFTRLHVLEITLKSFWASSVAFSSLLLALDGGL
jgi:hypothetical protein